MFRLKKNAAPSSSFAIYLRITVDGKRVEISMQRECDPAKWNLTTSRCIGNKEDAKILNAYLDTVQKKVYNAHQELLDNGAEITAEKIKNKLLGIDDNRKMILEIFKEHNNQMKELVGSEYAPLTLKRYETALSHVREFIKRKFKTSDLEISRLDYDFVSDYEFYLKSVRKCGHNSTVKYISNLKKVITVCVKKGWLLKDPFYGFKMAVREVSREILTQEELDKIISKKFSGRRMSVVKDIFLFSCYTGLAYVDVHKLKRSEIANGIDGEKWIIINRQKTNTSAHIPLLPICIEILNRYKDHPQCVNADRVLPVWCNQKMNEYLKEIADVCGIEKNLTYHMARHTFATTVTLNNGVPIETVSKMLGHKSIKITQHYAKVLDNKISHDMQILKNKFAANSQKEIAVIAS